MCFIWMVARASWKPSRVRYKGKAVTLERGQLCVSQRDMAAALGRDKAWIARFFKRLAREAMIEARSEAAALVITICNYDKYQSNSERSEAVSEAAREAPFEADVRQTRGTEQEGEEGKKLSDAKASSARAKTKWELPEDIPPEPWAGYEAMRRKKRAPLTDRARNGVVKKLRELAEHGHPPGDVLDQSTRNAWTDVYEIKGDRNGQHRQSGNSAGSAGGTRNGYLDAARRAAGFGAADYDGGMPSFAGMGGDAAGQSVRSNNA